MSSGSQRLNNAQAVVDTLRLGGGWRATVLLSYPDPGGLLPQAWPEVSREDWLNVLANPAELIHTSPDTQLFREGHSSRVVQRTLELGRFASEVFCKQSRRRNLLRKAIGLLRRTRPSWNWKVGWSLLAAGIPTALPLVVFEKRLAGLRVAAGIVTQSLLPGKTLEDFICQDAGNLSRPDLEHLTKDLAVLLSRLHQHHFFHRDLKGINIFVHFDQRQRPHLYLLDLDGCRSNRPGYLKKVKSLGRLARDSLDWPIVGRTARLRLLKAYLECSTNSSAQWKNWWRSIDQQVQRKSPRSDRDKR